MNDKSGSKVGRFPKTDKRYWQAKVIQRVYRRGGEEIQEPDFSVKIQFRGRRHRFILGSANRVTAAAKAQRIYASLLERGWDATCAEFANEAPAPDETVDQATVGQLIDTIQGISTARGVTLNAYFKAFRKIVGDIERIEKGGKYDSRIGSRKWRETVDAVALEDITPAKVQEWKITYIRHAGSDPGKQRSTRTTVNSLIRNSKALFSKKNLAILKEKIALPDPLPFEGIAMEKQPSMRYHSKIDAEQILRAARAELERSEPEAFKIFLLSLMCGLRKSEIDTLFWDAFDFEKRRLLIEPNEYNPLKSEDSAGEVELDPDLNEVFKQYRAGTESRFVIESENAPRNLAMTRSYRAEKHFNRLNLWLKGQGIESTKPLHTLRKEFGALITARFGIYAASRALRHSDIAITVAHYADKKDRVTVGLQGLSNADNPS